LPKNRKPTYRTIATTPLSVDPQVFEVTLPSDETQLDLWNDIDPLEHGADDLPPSLEDSALNDRVITWLRLNWGEGARARVQWVGINAAFVNQRARVTNELLPDANGEPDQEYALTNRPVIPESVRVTIRTTENQTDSWQLTDDLMAAGAEAPTADPRQHPGVMRPKPRPSKVFMVDSESGKIRFGDGFHGARPPLGATMRVDYDYGSGAQGNVGENAISSSPALPEGLKVSNPLRTWGGARAETISEGERQITRFLQNRDRLVNAVDFETIAMRTPGVEIARVEVLAAYNPMLARHEPGNAPGAVTLMVIPRYSAKRPDAPEPDELFLKAICDYLEPRRLVTTELFLNGPQYQPIYISVGISVVAGRNFSAAVVREQVAQRLKQFLSPIPSADREPPERETSSLTTPVADATRNGWPLGSAVLVRELEAEVARVPGVAMVNGLLLAGASGPEVDTRIEMQGLQLPRIDGIQVNVGLPTPIANVRGDIDQGPPAVRTMAPVPAIPKEC
jgi:predicted phage baseplate assembly protein